MQIREMTRQEFDHHLTHVVGELVLSIPSLPEYNRDLVTDAVSLITSMAEKIRNDEE